MELDANPDATLHLDFLERTLVEDAVRHVDLAEFGLGESAISKDAIPNPQAIEVRMRETGSGKVAAVKR